MKILVHHRIASRDGQSVHLDELAEALRMQGHTLLIVGPSSFNGVVFGASTSSVDFLKRLAPKPIFELLEIAYNLIAFQRLYRSVRRFRPDIIYERFSLFLFCGIWCGQIFRTPVLLEVNSPLLEERVASDALTLKSIGRWSQRWLFRQADTVLPVTEELAKVVCDYGASRKNVFVIPNGVNPRYFKDAIELSAAKKSVGLTNGLIIGFVGFVREWNAVHRLVRFASMYKDRFDPHIIIVGDGPARSSIESCSREFGVADRVTITGVIERSAISTWLSAIDIAVLPAVTWYSSPLKLFEYMALSRAIIAPDLANIREILTDGIDALLFGSKEGDMERALERLCDDQELRARIGRNARETISRRHLTWEGNAIKLGDIARDLVQQKAR